MPITVTCECGNSYTLKDEFAGKTVRCPSCTAPIHVAAAGPAAAPQADPAFDRDKFLLRQKHLAVSAKYEVWDEQGNPILYIERPAHLGQNVLAALAGVFAAGIVGVVFGLLAAATKGVPQAVLIVFAVLGSIVALIVVAVALCKKRHVTIYRDNTKAERLAEILQDKKVQFLRATYTVLDAERNLLARLHKSYIYDLIRKRWYCFAPDGSTMVVAKEDSVILSMLRRFLGPLFGFLRTNFVILEPTSERLMGEFIRKFTLRDRYVLDMSEDRTRSLDRRIALALGVMLDTGERR